MAIEVKASSSLLNADITPAAFWATNPNNSYCHNAIAGGTHFAFWYFISAHPEGPSYDTSICPRNHPLGLFKNNTAHTLGWFGLWVFPAYTPKVGGGCKATDPAEAVFEDLICYNTHKCAEGVNVADINLKSLIAVNCISGVEFKLLRGPTKVEDLFVSAAPSTKLAGKKTTCAVVGPHGRGLAVIGLTVVDCTGDCAAVCVAVVDGKTSKFSGGYIYFISGFVASYTTGSAVTTVRARYRWANEGLVVDVDGSFTGIVGASVLATTSLLPDGSCVDAGDKVTGVPGSICDPAVKFHRFGLKSVTPSSLRFRALLVTNTDTGKAAEVDFVEKDTTHKEGWVQLIPSGGRYNISFKDAAHVANISYKADAYDLKVGITFL